MRETTMTTGAIKLRLYARRHGWSVDRVGLELGVSKQQASRLMLGQRGPSIVTASRIETITRGEVRAIDWAHPARREELVA